MGTLHFKTSPDYEFPDDSNEDNQYEITIEISDGYSSLQVELVVRVLDLDETAQSPEDSRLLINGYSLGNYWREASWFGTYYTKYFPWVYHSSMGWVYIIQAQDGNAWMWQLKLGWMWTDIDIFPYFLINSTRKWGFAGSDSRAGETTYSKPATKVGLNSRQRFSWFYFFSLSSTLKFLGAFPIL